MISTSTQFSSKKPSSQIYSIFDQVINDILSFSQITQQQYNNKQQQALQQIIFEVKKIPNISIQKYVKRINKQVNFEEDEILLILILIDRLGVSNFILTQYNIHKIILGLIRVVSKFNQDFVSENKILAQIGGISTQELNEIELEILKLLNFKLYVDAQELSDYKKSVHEYYSNKQIQRELSF